MSIAVLDDYAGAALRPADWSGLGKVEVFSDTITDLDGLVERLSSFEVLCVMRERTPITAALMERLPNLRLIVTTGPRNASIDLAAAKTHGIVVSSTQSRKTTTSELAILMMLALNRRPIPEVAALNGPGGWQVGLGRDLAGLTLGVIGLGTIGAQMAAFGRAFGMEIVAWLQNLSQERCDEVGAERMDSLVALMARADVSSVHLVLSKRSEGLVDAEAFAAAKEGHVFINTSRGSIVDTTALLAGLRAGKPTMAGLDVFDVEPLPTEDPLRDHSLIENGNLLLTPHLGYTTEATFELFYTQTVEAITAWQMSHQVRVLT